jgi:hypothetical protein
VTANASAVAPLAAGTPALGHVIPASAHSAMHDVPGMASMQASP